MTRKTKPRKNKTIKVSRLLGSIPRTNLGADNEMTALWKNKRSAQTARNKKVKVTLPKTPWDQKGE